MGFPTPKMGGSRGGPGGVPGGAWGGPGRGVLGGGGGGGPKTPKKGQKTLHYKTPPGGCSNAYGPPVVQKRWKKCPVEPFFRCFRKYPPRYAKFNSEIVGVVGGGSKTPPKIQPKNAHFCTFSGVQNGYGRG